MKTLLRLIFITSLITTQVQSASLLTSNTTSPTLKDDQKHAGSKNAQNRFYDGREVVPRPNIIYDDSSEYLRAGKKYLISGGPGLLSWSLNAGYFVNPNRLYTLTFANQGEVLSPPSNFYAVGLKQFFDNSLFLVGRLAYKEGSRIKYEDSIIGNEVFDETKYFGIEIGLGNTWNWDHWLIGCEWVSIFSSFNNIQNKYVVVHFRGLSTHIGYMF